MAICSDDRWKWSSYSHFLTVNKCFGSCRTVVDVGQVTQLEQNVRKFITKLKVSLSHSANQVHNHNFFHNSSQVLILLFSLWITKIQSDWWRHERLHGRLQYQESSACRNKNIHTTMSLPKKRNKHILTTIPLPKKQVLSWWSLHQRFNHSLSHSYSVYKGYQPEVEVTYRAEAKWGHHVCKSSPQYINIRRAGVIKRLHKVMTFITSVPSVGRVANAEWHNSVSSDLAATTKVQSSSWK